LKESLIALVICTVGELVTGIVFGVSSSYLIILPALMLIIPPSLGLRGNIYSSLSSKISTYLHLGRIQPSLGSIRKISSEIQLSMILLLVMSFLIGVLAFIAYSAVKNRFTMIDFVNLADIALISVILSALFLCPMTIVLTVESYRFGWNPDNLTAPIVFLLGDIITLPLIFVAFDITYLLSNLLRILVLFAILISVAIIFFLYYNKRNSKNVFAIKESFYALFLCLLLQFMAGFILMQEIPSFIKFSGLLTVLPAFLSVGGSIGGILVARFSTLLHLGIIEPAVKPKRDILISLSLMHILSFVIFFILGILAYTLNLILKLSSPPLINTLTMIVFAGQVLTFFLNVISYYLSIFSFKFGFNPDNIGIPILSALMDYTGTFCFVLALRLFI